MEIFWLVLAFALWGLLHSWTASLGWKGWLQTRLGAAWVKRYYRLAYNLFALVSFLPLLWLTAALPDVLLYRLPFPWAGFCVLLQLLGAWLVLQAVRQTGLWTFLGLHQVLHGEEPPARFVVQGVYRWVRHPIYTGTLLLLWATPLMTRNTLVFNLLATLYIVIGLHFEERKLLREFGEPYRRYRQQTPMLWPRLRMR